jgi:hypothetical protein
MGAMAPINTNGLGNKRMREDRVIALFLVAR